ncbi:flagellar motor protein MotB [Paenibacillus sp.]|uniref:flagellar motor protein MotB n=1 Tax=Paenibacillus sp. TaxID=58172 RepID=UPI002D71AF72|nr:flagellar motor protein MotB [Paenibacillus sp.]HZG58593.1 flagellar motor protein MotB [Paenibacillus sp.]
MSKKQRKHDHEEHIDESWLIPYADLLTLLLALFIVLFASSQIDQKKFEQIKMSFQAALAGGPSFMENVSPVPSNDSVGVDNKGKEEQDEQSQQELEQQQRETEQLMELKRKIDRFIEENGLTTQLETKLDNQQLKITISDNTLFASGSAQLKPESRALAATISQLLEQYRDYEVVVAGHTDNVPINTSQFPSNFHLSAERALSFMAVLLENPNVGEERFSSVGYGEHKPVATNDTAEGRAENRRVEVSIVRNIQ